jgi:fructokinase
MRRYGAIEGGGTKWICGVGTCPADLVTQTIPTTAPLETMAAAARFFTGQHIHALGIATFGPVDLQRGRITTTPKPGWRDTDVAGFFRKVLGVPVSFDTDVNGAALGELRWGAAQGLTDFLYLTVGTGIGGGAVSRGQLVHGVAHPEMGHLLIPHDLARDPFAGVCPFHGDCLEGLASGPAIAKRWGTPAQDLPPDHPGWALQAHYLAAAVHNLTCTLSPRKIVLGGGVMEHPGLLARVEERVRDRMNGYLSLPDGFLVSPGLGNRAGVCGALVLAENAR